MSDWGGINFVVDVFNVGFDLEMFGFLRICKFLVVFEVIKKGEVIEVVIDDCVCLVIDFCFKFDYYCK